MQLPAGLFKAKCLRLMDEVQKFHHEITITKFGKPVAKLIPFEEKKSPLSLFGLLKGEMLIKDDLIKPIDERWEADVKPG
ncbi:MAG: type II toxin-antitoxin system prevent-host-death family antitoxin [Chlamydiae bacterium]|nr:type II toxin-antitoxin system prevent-host-death family antitoxin [Chlamydiota bacterium]MBI3266441.1 type II toxin-antitoxin system prevent-host-death family antitoxin [Chlamydiota bacterium]